ncbi:hypothetical protein [Acinetobacter sp. MD2(2019)]|uniref:hypothetical protein n=1 Tax=Acinetobacter sp. MD2(2019) TaxID=2605273 RepID=UPI002D792577|nr:hypothetical protein [Acinetobacter sp. MD2(2019)]
MNNPEMKIKMLILSILAFDSTGCFLAKPINFFLLLKYSGNVMNQIKRLSVPHQPAARLKNPPCGVLPIL